MAAFEKQAHDSETINSILRGLTNRPNVQSTLILSRRDGSIIKATGFQDVRGSATLGRQTYTTSDVSTQDHLEQDDGYAKQDSLVVSSPGAVRTQAERLANCIHAFVTASSDLAECMSAPEPMMEPYNGNITDSTNNLQREKSSGSAVAHTADQDVQLLRMRTKKQEIIIFPDPSYLCCVIQTIGKVAT